jgi:hypothetical protein
MNTKGINVVNSEASWVNTVRTKSYLIDVIHEVKRTNWANLT